MKLINLTLFFLLVLPVSITKGADDAAIGHIVTVEGSPTLVRGTENAKSLVKDDVIYLNDIINTDDGELVEVVFSDKTNIILSGKDGELTIDEYIFDPKNPEQNRARYSILRASFEFVGGLIDEGGNTQVDMDFGSIGIRGTKFIRSMKDGQCWIYLEEGMISVFNKSGTVDLKPGQGTRMTGASGQEKAPPPAPAETWSDADVNWIKQAVRNKP